MKRLIILFLVICSTVCDFESCVDEEDLTKCSSHILDGIDGYSCRLIHSHDIDFDTGEYHWTNNPEDEWIYMGDDINNC